MTVERQTAPLEAVLERGVAPRPFPDGQSSLAPKRALPADGRALSRAARKKGIRWAEMRRASGFKCNGGLGM